MSILRMAAISGLAALGTLVSPAANAQQPFYVWNNQAQCAMSRGQWLTVAQGSPGGGWASYGPGGAPFESAIAQMDVLRAGDSFSTYCCKVAVYSHNQTKAMIIIPEGTKPPENMFLERAGICGEQAAVLFGISAPQFTDFRLGSVPGAVLRVTANGLRGVGGPVTIPGSPPVTFAALATGGGGTGAMKATFSFEMRLVVTCTAGGSAAPKEARLHVSAANGTIAFKNEAGKVPWQGPLDQSGAFAAVSAAGEELRGTVSEQGGKWVGSGTYRIANNFMQCSGRWQSM